MKRIAFILDELAGGGVERVMLNLAAEFARQGYRVDLVAVKGSRKLTESLPAGVKVVLLNARRTMTGFYRILSYLRRERPEAIVSARNHLNVAVAVATRLARIGSRVVMTFHNFTALDLAGNISRQHVALIRFLAKMVYSWPVSLVAVSTAVANDHVAYFSIQPKRIRVIANPVVTDLIYQLAADDDAQPRRWADGMPLIVAVGRLAVEKDFATLINAFCLLTQSVPAKLAILGDGPERDRLQELIVKLGLVEKVLLFGYASNPYVWMYQADIFVSSSQTEGLPTAIVEALALGTKVVATSCAGTDEVLQGGKYGFLCPVGEADKLADAMLAALFTPIASFETELAKYTPHQAFRAYESVMFSERTGASIASIS